MTPSPGWTRLVDSTEVEAGTIVGSAVDGVDVVIWRSADGSPCVMEARCPHQWSHLAAAGAVDGEEIVCLTHMWRFDTAGQGSKRLPDGEREPQAQIPAFPCVERDGAVWAKLP